MHVLLLLLFYVGTFVATVTATDADDHTYGNSAKLVYSILQGQPYFSVDSETGKPNSEKSVGMHFYYADFLEQKIETWFIVP